MQRKILAYNQQMVGYSRLAARLILSTVRVGLASENKHSQSSWPVLARESSKIANPK